MSKNNAMKVRLPGGEVALVIRGFGRRRRLYLDVLRADGVRTIVPVADVTQVR